MGKKIDLTGMTFGRLTVARESSKRDRHGDVHWDCVCACGGIATVRSSSLRKGDTQSCGCLFIESAAAKGRAKARHGMTGTRTYNAWMGMRSRCENPKNRKFKDYGARGISVCEQWACFDTFFSDMGACPGGMSIERLDVNGHYEPGNCVWADQRTQQNNRRNNVFIEYGGETETISEWARRTGIKPETLSWRLKQGWPVAEVLTALPWKRRASNV